MMNQLAQLQQKVDDLYKNRNATPNLDSDKSQALLSTEKSSPFNGQLSIESTSQPFDSSQHFGIFQPTDTFVTSTSSPGYIASSSQIRALRGLRNTKRSSESGHNPTEKIISVKLPEKSILWSQVEAFFEEFGCFWPFLREEKVRQRLSAVLDNLDYGDKQREIKVTAENCKIIAILLNMLAYASLMTEPYTSEDSTPGSQTYCKGLSLMETFAKLHDNDLDTMIYHTLSAAFFLGAEKLQMALQSASQGFYIARRTELNNQKQWPTNVQDEIVCRQSLWWTLYFLDKRITQKIGITYSVRENECGVRDFFDAEDDRGLQDHHQLLQSMIAFSQLWSYIWDCFFSPRAFEKQDDWEDLELTDTRIMLAYRRLPSTLHWSSENVFNYMTEESERHIRRRILVFLRRESCVSLCKGMVDAVQAYTDTFGCPKPSGYFLTSALVESLYWVELERRQDVPILPESLLNSTKSLATKLLRNLSSESGAAARAYEALGDVLSTESLGSLHLGNFDELIESPRYMENMFDLGEMWNDKDPFSLDFGAMMTDSKAISDQHSKSTPSPSTRRTVETHGSHFNHFSEDFDWYSLMQSLPSGESDPLDLF
ncbi:uncharacterized protein N7503_000567 [Penicillium pulvis]|uniref:uncharacterized protein n=1 Tax=Penicillium pulvis TaxID=1562058 RepID=UPI002546B91D|nr:uncharacterized protein N7503_000567 [Penicillium pulvis]KAJ5813817.1 hypothetical protein N7503_000567 [Penicillium pulvis]